MGEGAAARIHVYLKENLLRSFSGRKLATVANRSLSVLYLIITQNSSPLPPALSDCGQG